MIGRIGVGLGCGILGLTRLASGALKSLSGSCGSLRVGCAKVYVDGFDGGVIWVVGVRGEVAGDADVDVFLGQVVLVNENLADLVGVVGIFAVLGIATFDQEAGVAALDDRRGVGLDFVRNAEDFRDLGVERRLRAEEDVAVGVGRIVAVVHEFGVGADLAVVAGDELEEAQQ